MKDLEPKLIQTFPDTPSFYSVFKLTLLINRQIKAVERMVEELKDWGKSYRLIAATV